MTTTPPDLLQRMAKYPQQLDDVMMKAGKASLLVIQENVPPYPPQPPNSHYRRTGTLGRSLGVGQTGGAVGMPDIFTVKKVGSHAYEGEFGSRLSYAPDVVGEGSQKPIFKAIGWFTTKTIAQRAAGKVVEVYEIAARKMAEFLEGRA